MMKWLFLIFCTLQLHGESIFQRAQEQNRAIVAVYLNPIEECPWSKKLFEEVVSNPRFLEKVNEVAIVWQVEDPRQCQERPAILLLDPHGVEFSRLGILPLEGEGYGEEIIARIEAFQEVCSALDLDGGVFEEKRWKALYQKAKNFSADCYRKVILDRGVEYERGIFFHLEKYAELIDVCKKKHPQLERFKQKIFKRDKRNKKGSRFFVAVLEFQNRTKLHHSKAHIKKNLRPLLEYIATWGKEDEKHLWEAEKMIAEYLWSKGVLPQAMVHAEACHKIAPEEGQREIGDLIALMQRQMRS